MWKEIWNLLSERETLLSEAFDEAVDMLDLDREMFAKVTVALEKNISPEEMDELRQMDKKLNKVQQDIRKKVFEHLAVSKGQDLLSGLVLTSIVIDLERIGDYSKNIGDLVSLFEGDIDLGDRKDMLDLQLERSNDIFDLTRSALADQDKDAAKKCMKTYGKMSRDCDAMLEDIIGGAKNDAAVSKADLSLVLLMRYYKRVGAHLKNIASATVAPFPMIGYSLKKKKKNGNGEKNGA
jgi:phosphate transport system protein